MKFSPSPRRLHLAAEPSEQNYTVEMLRSKREEWSRQLHREPDLHRQLQLVNLIKSVESMLDAGKLRQRERPRWGLSEDDGAHALEVLREARNEGHDCGGQSAPHPATAAA